MWFWLAVTALLFWSGSDLFSKIGCRDNDKYAHLKMVIAVGVIMGIHALYEIFAGGTVVTWHVLITYLPVSLLYISSMTLGYIGLRYIELSISSPICNSSGALVAVLCFLTGTLDDSIEGTMRLAVIGAVALVCVGVIGLGIVESREDDDLRRARQEASNYKYAKSWLALFLPAGYCLLDAAGTFADTFVLDKLAGEAEAARPVCDSRRVFLLCGIFRKLRLRADLPLCGSLLCDLCGIHQEAEVPCKTGRSEVHRCSV